MTETIYTCDLSRTVSASSAEDGDERWYTA